MSITGENRLRVVAVVFATLILMLVSAHVVLAAAFCSPFTNCFRDDDCESVGGYCRNRVCQCPYSAAPPVCADRCPDRGYCHPGQCGGTTIHITDCRGISSGPRGGVISYCDLPSPVATPVTPALSSTPSATPAVPEGRVWGSCSWNDDPYVTLRWSPNAPGSVVPVINELQKGDCYPRDPGRYWCVISDEPGIYEMRDDDVQRDTQYQYRVKYRTDVASVNTYGIYTSAQLCGGPVPTPGPLDLTPSYQTAPPNVTVLLTATGGTGTYAWEAASGSISGFGNTVGVMFTNDSIEAVERTVTVRSGEESATARVLVEGIKTFTDDIVYTGWARRLALINDDDETTESPDVTVALAHGFFDVATESITMRIGRSIEEARVAPPRAYAPLISWNLCANPLQCPSGLYAVYAIFSASSGRDSPVTFDTIGYLAGTEEGIGAAIAINDGDAVTYDRYVRLSLRHRFIGLPDTEVVMQVANAPEQLDTTAPVAFSAALDRWDLCDHSSAVCAPGMHTVYARFCAYGACSGVVTDDIDLSDLWPPWGVRVNDDDADTPDPLVTLSLNPWFGSAGTTVLVSNNIDMLDAAWIAYTSTLSWDLCRFSAPCTDGDKTVYVQYQNATTQWPASSSPQYTDVIRLGLAPTPTPPVLPLDAGVLINGGAMTTTSRFVELEFASPFATEDAVTMRPVNERSLSADDRSLIDDSGGGIRSQRTATDVTTTSDGRATGQGIPAGVAATAELRTGTVRPFIERLDDWDLCDGASQCPYGTYKVFVQYYREMDVAGSWKTVAAFSAVLAAGQEASGIYVDDIEFQPTTLPPATPVTSPGTGGGGGAGGGGDGGGGVMGAVRRAENVIVPVSIVSSVIVTTSALMALVPLFTGTAGTAALGSAAWDWLMRAFGLLPRRKKIWGTVYDASTKRPIPFAKVQLLGRNKRVLETRAADKEGRYGFLTTPISMLMQEVEISLTAQVPGYTFPSVTKPGVESFVYGNIYRGGSITVSNETLINFDIPLDPVKPSAAPLVLTSPSIALGASVAALSDAGFWLGLVMVPLNFLLAPNPFTFGIMCLFLGASSLRIFGIGEHPFGTVIDSTTGRPMSFALMTLNDTSGKRIAFAVTDELGRYFIAAPKGVHELVVHAPGAVQPPRQHRLVLDVRKGWLTKRIVV